MIRFDVTFQDIALDVDAISQDIVSAAQQAFAQAISVDLAQDVFTPDIGASSGFVNWTSQDQKETYHRTKGFGRGAGKNNRYVRSGRLQNSWEYDVATQSDRIILTTRNTARDVDNPVRVKYYATYVIGNQQQGFHANTGWKRFDTNALIYTRRVVALIMDALGRQDGQNYIITRRS